MRVLLVDDSRALRQSLGRALSGIGGLQIVGEAGDAAGALDQIERLRPDLVVLDVDLGAGGRGMDVLVHSVRSYPEIAVMMLSNFGWDAMRSGFLTAGAAAYFDKGFEFKLAREWVARMVATRQMKAQQPE